MTITAEVRSLTPADANRLLDANTHNRLIKQGDVLKWATEMEAGNWTLNGEAIKISSTGKLLDGQHRLHALALQNEDVHIEFLVVEGLPDAVQTTMDQGRKRGLADQITLSGVPINGSVAAAMRLFVAWEAGLFFQDRKRQDAELTAPVMAEWAHAHPDIVEMLQAGITFKKVKCARSTVACAYTIIARTHSMDVADEFFARVSDGANQPLGSPILAMRNKLDQMRGDTRSDGYTHKVSIRDQIGMFIVAFNAWYSEKSLSKIQRPHGGTWNADTYPRVLGPKRSK